MMKRTFLGLDWGGTFLKIGIFDAQGKILAKRQVSSRNLANPSNFFNFLKDILAEELKKINRPFSSLKAAGIGAPGIINIESGFIYYLPNIKGWKNFSFKKTFEQKLKIPLFIDNDANVAALAELKRGKAKGVKNGVLFTLGTGLGSGLIIDGKVFHGKTSAAEAGHMPISLVGEHCGCGSFGCVETFIGNKYLLAYAKSIFKKRNINLRSHNTLSCKELYSLALQGNKAALEVWSYFGNVLGAFSAGLVNLLNLEIIILTGGISGAFRFIAPAMKKAIQKRAMYPLAGQVRIAKSDLGADAGIIGACELIRQGLDLE